MMKASNMPGTSMIAGGMMGGRRGYRMMLGGMGFRVRENVLVSSYYCS